MKIERLTAESFRDMQKSMLKRSPDSYPAEEAVVRDIIAHVKEEGDAALFDYEERFDHVKLDRETIKVSAEEIEEAYSLIDEKLVDVIRKAIVRIRRFHEEQKAKSWFITEENGMVLGQKVTAMERVGVYVPGGKAAYPSSVLMNIVPAKVAGVDEIIMCTPPGRDGKVTPTTLVAAHEAGADVIYKLGGAQAVAAMAFGTETIPKTDKITGPGNIYVALAKKAVYGFVSIDSVAGPSEITVLADETANAHHVAADLLSQAEHDRMATAVLITTDHFVAERTAEQLEMQLADLPRQDIARESVEVNGKIIITDTIEEAIDLANKLAPEHLELFLDDAEDYVDKIENAGSVFVGKNCPEALGDYFAGPNHTLPTSGTARFASPLTVDDFTKKMSLTYYEPEALDYAKDKVALLAREEGLEGHARSILSRFE